MSDSVRSEPASPHPVDTLQAIGHPAGYDYDVGSPHLSHPQLRSWLVETLRQLTKEQFARRGSVRVLEVGAGHGAFTDHLLATGATVTLTEMSPASYEMLRERYERNSSAHVVFDEDGSAPERLGETFDLVVCVSVLHHIPDYLAAIRAWADVTDTGGAFVSFQDPLWYPRRTRANLLADRSAYFMWRARRGDVVEGVKTRARRMRGHYDPANWRDMVEYHVVRQGCDESAIVSELQDRYGQVTLTPYWSTQSRILQSVGERMNIHTTFAVVARDRRGPNADDS